MTTTTLSGAWILRRRDGRVFGFCDHGRALTVAGVTCEPAAALTPSEAAASIGLAPDEMDVAGALSADTLREADIAAGLWDGAEVSAYEIDWSDGTSRLTGRYTLGAIERSGAAFRAELRSRAAGLDRPQGRSYLNACDARLGDKRCRVDLNMPGRRAVGTVLSASGLSVTISGIGALNLQHLARGQARALSGAAAGLDALEIRTAARAGNDTVLNLWYRPAAALQPGDRIEVTVGCDCVGLIRGVLADVAGGRIGPRLPVARCSRRQANICCLPRMIPAPAMWSPSAWGGVRRMSASSHPAAALFMRQKPWAWSRCHLGR